MGIGCFHGNNLSREKRVAWNLTEVNRHCSTTTSLQTSMQGHRIGVQPAFSVTLDSAKSKAQVRVGGGEVKHIPVLLFTSNQLGTNLGDGIVQHHSSIPQPLIHEL